VLLSVLEERVLPLRGKHIAVHPDFRIIFTSNPADYAAFTAPRMLSSTEWSDPAERVRPGNRSRYHPGPLRDAAGRGREDRRPGPRLRDAGLKTSSASVRPAILIARILRVRGGHPSPRTRSSSRPAGTSSFPGTPHGHHLQEDQQNEQTLLRLIQEICSAPLPASTPLSKRHPCMEAGSLMAELGEDKEVQDCCSRKFGRGGFSTS